MSKIIMMRGLPRSGKSTWAKEFLVKSGNAVIVSRDALRDMLHNNKWNHRNEKITMGAQKALVEHLLKNTQTVIIDDTNLTDAHLQRWGGLAKELGVGFEIHEEKEADLKVLVERDMGASPKRGAHVIVNMALAHGKVDYPDDSIVLCDLDGTLADCEHRRHHLQGEKKNWKGFFDDMMADPVIRNTHDMLKAYIEQGKKIIFVSARPEDRRMITENWLDLIANFELAHYAKHIKHSATHSFEALIMRPAGDSRPDTIVKQELLDKYIKKSWVHVVIDDRPSVVQMWRDNGLTVIDVGNGVDF